jgi:hypothetical protein
MSNVFADGTLVKESSKPDTYVVYSGKRMLVYDGASILLIRAMGLDLANTRTVSDGSLSSIPLIKLESAPLTPPSLVFPPDNKGQRFFLDTNGSISLITQGKEIRIAEIRGWLRTIHGGCNGADPDWHYYLDVDPEWAESKDIDLNQILKVGNMLNANFLITKNEVKEAYLLNKSLAFAAVTLPTIKVELNGWRRYTPDLEPHKWLYTTTLKPLDWNFRSSGDLCPNIYGEPPIWPYDPLHPDPSDPKIELTPGDYDINDKAPYVSISGSILTDNPHLEEAWGSTILVRYYGGLPLFLRDAEKQLQDRIRVAGQIWGGNKAPTDPTHPARWTEIHPPDIIKVLPYKEPKETVRGVAVVASNGLVVGETRSLSGDIYPPSPRPPSSRLEVKEYVGMETNFRTIIEGNANKNGARIRVYDDRVNIYVKVQGQGGWGAPGKFKAIYRVRWAPIILGELVPLKLYYSDERRDNFTTATQDGIRSAEAAGYRYVRDEGMIYSRQDDNAGLVPLRLYYSDERRDNFTTATQDGIRSAEAAGYRYVRDEGYVFTQQEPDRGLVPLRLYYSDERRDNFTTATQDGIRSAEAAGYRYVRDEGYITTRR